MSEKISLDSSEFEYLKRCVIKIICDCRYLKRSGAN